MLPPSVMVFLAPPLLVHHHQLLNSLNLCNNQQQHLSFNRAFPCSQTSLQNVYRGRVDFEKCSAIWFCSTWGQADTLHSNPASIGKKRVFAKTMSSPSSPSTLPLSQLLRTKTSLIRWARVVVFPQVVRIVLLRLELGGRESTSTNNSVSGEQAGGWVEWGEVRERKML